MTTAPHPNWKRKLLLSAAAMLAAALLATACSKKAPAEPGNPAPPSASTGDNNPQTPSGNGQSSPAGQPAPGGDAAKPAEPVKLVPLEFTEMYRQTLLDSAKAQGIKTVYVPKLGAQDDRISQIQGMEKAFTLQYLNMELIESSQEIKPSGQVENEKQVKLKNGNGQWVTAGGQTALYMKRGDTYLALRSLQKLTDSDIEAIADSLGAL
ncbi:hypothetical protein WMW72_25670 [Paenibacillus filicis]|uniref:DUF4367 domain-containing protein n=1 Tax=Paenibacillus filicis TaxID=669464 RepID=A0ABU9DR08_9BACL